ncbi:hypothetical protein [Singulisphaera sp. PoT]|uniref:hypothetical protein n=1 Tax=Singulisphaera sp. PoT TaxID=3411797 RepID=UPI003BF541D0
MRPTKGEGIPPDDTCEPALMTPRRLANEVLSITGELAKLIARVQGVAAYVDHASLDTTVTGMTSDLANLGKIRGKILIGEIKIVAGRDDAAGRDRYPLYEKPDGTPRTNGKPDKKGRRSKAPAIAPGSPAAKVIHALHTGGPIPPQDASSESDDKSSGSETDAPETSQEGGSSPDDEPAPPVAPTDDVYLLPNCQESGTYEASSIPSLVTPDAMERKLIRIMNGAPPHVSGFVDVGLRRYAVTSVSRSEKGRTFKLVPVQHRMTWGGPLSKERHPTPEAGWYGIVLNYKSHEYVMGHKSQELTVVTSKQPARKLTDAEKASKLEASKAKGDRELARLLDDDDRRAQFRVEMGPSEPDDSPETEDAGELAEVAS